MFGTWLAGQLLTLAEELLSERDVQEVEIVDPHLLVLWLGPVDEPAGHQGVTTRGESSLAQNNREEEEEAGKISEHCDSQTDSWETITGLFMTAAWCHRVRTNHQIP